jgi:hypothetical protein
VYDTHHNEEKGKGSRSAMMTAIDAIQHVVIELMANTITHFSIHI